MSREIKFRLHCAATGKILAYEKFNTALNWGYYWYDATLPEDDQICQTLDYFKHPHPLGKVVRVEFTGLKDKSGVEIYEGDITTMHGLDVSYYESGKYCRGVVEFVNGAFRQVFTHNDGSRYFDEIDDCDVVGNIYQHPELLK